MESRESPQEGARGNVRSGESRGMARALSTSVHAANSWQAHSAGQGEPSDLPSPPSWHQTLNCFSYKMLKLKRRLEIIKSANLPADHLGNPRPRKARDSRPGPRPRLIFKSGPSHHSKCPAEGTERTPPPRGAQDSNLSRFWSGKAHEEMTPWNQLPWGRGRCSSGAHSPPSREERGSTNDYLGTTGEIRGEWTAPT